MISRLFPGVSIGAIKVFLKFIPSSVPSHASTDGFWITPLARFTKLNFHTRSPSETPVNKSRNRHEKLTLEIQALVLFFTAISKITEGLL